MVKTVPGSDDPVSPNGLLGRLRLLAAPVFYLAQNPASLVGVSLATSLFFTMLLFYVATSVGVSPNPYVGIVAFLVLPGIFLLGLFLIPAGMLLKRRR